jgi:hypothetical protein
MRDLVAEYSQRRGGTNGRRCIEGRAESKTVGNVMREVSNDVEVSREPDLLLWWVDGGCRNRRRLVISAFAVAESSVGILQSSGLGLGIAEVSIVVLSRVAILNPWSSATKVTNPTIMATPRRRFLFGSTNLTLTSPSGTSPRKISGSKWNKVSPSRPPTANATITFNELGSTLVGTSASRKLGGPEI